MAFPPQFLDEIRARVPLSALVGRKVKLTRAGREWKCPCPFHKEKTPSFYINDQKGFFHCFGCGAHGDAVGFTMRHDNLSFLEAVEALAAEAGLEVPKPTEQERHRYEAEKTQHEVLEFATLWFEEQLRKPAGRKALEYLHKRGLDDATIAAFRLGYAPADAQALKTALAAKGAKEQDLIDLQLIRRSEDGGRTYSFFRDRVIFPVSDRRGRPIAFGARLLEGEGPKYVNSPEHALFHKGETLYGLARARLAAGDGQPVIVAEGYMDVIALNRAGYQGAVAPMGTALTEQQVEALWRLIPTGLRAPILCLDGDNAGQRAAERAVDRVLPLLQPDHTLKIAFMPSGEDPDSLLRHGGPAAIKQVLDSAIPLSEMVWRSTLTAKPGRTPEEQAGFRAALLDRVERIANKPVRENYRAEMLRRLREAFREPWQPPTRKGPKRDALLGPGAKPARRPARGDAMRSKTLLAIMLRNPFLFEEFCEHFMELPVPASLQALHGSICEALSESSAIEPGALHLSMRDAGHGEALDALLEMPLSLHTSWLRADMDQPAIRAGWMRVFAHAARSLIAEEIRQASVELAESDDAMHWNRLVALQNSYAELAKLDEDSD
jgi:DNA primase